MKSTTKVWLYYAIAAFIFGCIVFTNPAHSQTFKAATGVKDLNYSAMLHDMQKYCSKELAIQEVNSTGSLQNIDWMTNNTVNGGFTQIDAMYLQGRNDANIDSLKTLLMMNKETVHFIVKSDLAFKSGGVNLGFTRVNPDVVPITSVSQIKGMTVAAGGGGWATVRQINGEAKLGIQPVQAKDSTDAMAMLDSGAAQVALIVSAPTDYLRNMPPKYRLLSMPDDMVQALAGAYTPTRAAYNGIAPDGVTTVQVPSAFVVYNYRSGKMQAQLTALRDCVLKNLVDIREAAGSSAAWRTVTLADQERPKWPSYKTDGTADVQTISDVPTAKKARQ